MSSLLVSVRNVAEARVARDAGVDVIDVKEPARGSLGRAEEGVLDAVVQASGGCEPPICASQQGVHTPRSPLISAAMGELHEWDERLPASLSQLAFVKWGLAHAPHNWIDRTLRLRREVEERSPCRVVLAAYADHRRACAPSPREVCTHAVQGGFSALLIDTWVKDGTSLMGWQSCEEIQELIDSCHHAGVRIALAGSLSFPDIETLLPRNPDWFAVRGAACANGERGATIDKERVRALVELLGESAHQRTSR